MSSPFPISFAYYGFLLSLLVLAQIVGSSSSEDGAAVREISLHNRILWFSLSESIEHLSTHTKNEFLSCERIRIAGLSRFNISSYANSFHVILRASNGMPEKHHSKVEICFHQNSSLGSCLCKKDEWRNLQMGEWTTFMSPYGERYIDVKCDKKVFVSIVVSITEEFQQWRLLCLAFGSALLLLAPIISSWVPFYYSSSMAVGILLVILIILFQGMKLIPTGRKSFLYITIYGSILGAGSFMVHYFSMLVNSILVNFGLSEEMYNPVSIFLLAGITLAGAAVGYWAVRKFVLLEDGTVDTGIAQFVKWAMRILGIVFILQSTLDAPLAFAAILIIWGICSLLTSVGQRLRSLKRRNSGYANIWQLKRKQVVGNQRCVEFLSRSPNTGSTRLSLSTRNSPYGWPGSPIKGLIYSTPNKRRARQIDYYSTFHKTPRRRFSKKEWDNFTNESTKEALVALASTPEFSDWIAENSHRIHLTPKDYSDGGTGSSSSCSEETMESEDDAGFFSRFIPH